MKKLPLILLSTVMLASCNQPPATVEANKPDLVSKWVVVSTTQVSDYDKSVKTVVVLNTVDGLICRVDRVDSINDDPTVTKKNCIDL